MPGSIKSCTLRRLGTVPPGIGHLIFFKRTRLARLWRQRRGHCCGSGIGTSIYTSGEDVRFRFLVACCHSRYGDMVLSVFDNGDEDIKFSCASGIVAVLLWGAILVCWVQTFLAEHQICAAFATPELFNDDFYIKIFNL